MLTSEQMQTIASEVTLGKKPSVAGKEAREFRAKVTKEIEDIRKSGGKVEIPHEWADAESDGSK